MEVTADVENPTGGLLHRLTLLEQNFSLIQRDPTNTSSQTILQFAFIDVFGNF